MPALTEWQRRSLAHVGQRDPMEPANVVEMCRDAMVDTALKVKRLAVLAAAGRVLAPEGEEGRRRAEFVQEAFERMAGSPQTVLAAAMDAFARGWSVQQVEWKLDGGLLWPSAVVAKDVAHFGMGFDRYGSLTRLTSRLPGEAEVEVPREGMLVWFYRGGFDSPRGKSDLVSALPHWQAKQALLKSWRFHLERFAMPTVMGKVQRSMAEEERSSLLRAMQDLHNHTAVVYPEEAEIGLLGGDRGPSGGFVEAIEFHNREIARAILGQTLTTDEGRRVGSLALGKVHLQVLLLQVAAIRHELADSVLTEQLIRPMVEWNFGPGPIPRYRFDEVPLEAFSAGLLA